jgi:hypothetical protein
MIDSIIVLASILVMFYLLRASAIQERLEEDDEE